MRKICMTCGKTENVEPKTNDEVTHGMCSEFCASVYRIWTQRCGKDRGASLTEFYQEAKRVSAQKSQNSQTGLAEEKSAPSWHAMLEPN